MSIARCWTELREGREDLAALLAFRRSALDTRARRRLAVAAGLVLALTVVAVYGPAYLGGPVPRDHAGSVLALLPSLCLGFLALVVLASIAAAGGREVIPKDQAVAFPISTTSEHFGALLMAPLNIAWLVQSWALLGAASYALGPRALLRYELPVMLWILCATALAQVVGWYAEGVRRSRFGPLVFRTAVLVLLGLVVALVLSHRLTPLLDVSPTRVVLVGVLAAQVGLWGSWSTVVGSLAALAVVAAVLGALPARWALLRPMREELRLESGRYRPRRLPRSDLAMVLRLDRAAVWRSVPLRRGLTVLALMPGAVALAGALEWKVLTILPGLVASGCALLFGVNTWCLDGRGALWRDSLPLSPRVGFYSRVWVLFEVLVCSVAVTLVLGSLRAGRPHVAEVVAVLCSTLVVAIQVVAAGMRWSIARPYAVDLRSARATPAPPVMMVGYSARLALSTTVTGLVFSGLAQVPDVRLALAVTVVMLAWSGFRLERSARRWQDPVVRSRVVATVSG